MDDGGVIENLRKAGWRQGDLVPVRHNARIIGASRDLRPIGDPDMMRLVVLTHDCDLLRPVDREPYVELLSGRTEKNEDKLCRNGRHPRILCAPLGSAWLKFSIHDRFRVEKAAIAGVLPDGGKELPETERKALRQWVTKRYTRAAFPDEFNRRVDTQSSRFDKLLRSGLSNPISCIFIRFGKDAELPPGTPYRINILLAKPALSADCERFEHALEQCFLSCPEIEVEAVNSWLEDDITLRMIREYKRWDFDFRSLPQDDEAAAPPEGVDEV